MRKTVLLSFILFTSISCFAQQTYYGVTAGNGYGLRFWNSDYYKIHMGNTGEYHYGPVYDYSIKSNMTIDAGRGWTWGVHQSTPVAGLSNTGHMQIAGDFTATGKLKTNSGSINSGSEALLLMYGERNDDNYYEWTGFYSGTTRQGIILYDGAWSGANNLTNEFSISAENGNLLTLNTQGTNIALMPKGSGNVGIGSTSPIAKLDVYGPVTGNGPTIRASGGGDLLLNNGGSLFFDGNYSYASGNYIRPLATNTQAFFTSGLERFRISSTGNIGIGTSSPINQLQIGPNTPGWSGNDFVVGNSNGSLAIHTNPTDTYFYGNKDISIRPGNGQLAIYAKSNGDVGIGTTNPDSKLTVKGIIHTQEVKVDLNGSVAPDYVFEKDYPLTSLEELKSYINQYKHLPEIPSAKEMEEEGINLKEMNLLLLKKVEELTLHLIELKKEKTYEIELLQSQIDQLKRK